MTVPPNTYSTSERNEDGDKRLLVQGHMAKNNRNKICLLPRFSEGRGRGEGKRGPLPPTLQNY